MALHRPEIAPTLFLKSALSEFFAVSKHKLHDFFFHGVGYLLSSLLGCSFLHLVFGELTEEGVGFWAGMASNGKPPSSLITPEAINPQHGKSTILPESLQYNPTDKGLLGQLADNPFFTAVRFY